MSAPLKADLLSLPDEVLKLVLSHVTLPDRLGSCCLVHSRLRAAAVAAMQQLKIGVTIGVPRPNREQSLHSWLSLYGQHLTCVDIQGLRQPLAQLPCPNLLELRVIVADVQLGPTADGRPGVVAGITKLTRLELGHVEALDGPVVDSLSRLVHLRHLFWAPQAGGGAVGLSDATLPRLQHLTYLGGRLPLSNILRLGVLTSLQQFSLNFDFMGPVSPSSFAGLVLPPSLTYLELSTYADSGFESAKFMPSSVMPTGLRVLHVSCSSVKGFDGLLSCINRLQCLMQLELCAGRATEWPPPGPAYSALTASSSLVSLELVGDLPAEVWPFMFCATHQLPHLTSLALSAGRINRDVAWAFREEDLTALSSCCRRLCEIKHMCLFPGRHFQGLAAVTQLKTLQVDLGRQLGLGLASLLPLTSLTALTSISCSWRDEDVETTYHHRTQVGSPPDVWLQLLEVGSHPNVLQQLREACVATDPGCQPSPAQPGAANE